MNKTKILRPKMSPYNYDIGRTTTMVVDYLRRAKSKGLIEDDRKGVILEKEKVTDIVLRNPDKSSNYLANITGHSREYIKNIRRKLAS